MSSLKHLSVVVITLSHLKRLQNCVLAAVLISSRKILSLKHHIVVMITDYSLQGLKNDALAAHLIFLAEDFVVKASFCCSDDNLKILE